MNEPTNGHAANDPSTNHVGDEFDLMSDDELVGLIAQALASERRRPRARPRGSPGGVHVADHRHRTRRVGVRLGT